MESNNNENNQNSQQQQPENDNNDFDFDEWHSKMLRRRKILKTTGIVLLCVIGIPVIVFGVCLIIISGGI